MSEQWDPDLMQAEMLAVCMAIHINSNGRMAASGKVKPMALARKWGLKGRSMRDVLPTLVLAIQDAREKYDMEPWHNGSVERALAK